MNVFTTKKHKQTNKYPQYGCSCGFFSLLQDIGFDTNWLYSWIHISLRFFFLDLVDLMILLGESHSDERREKKISTLQTNYYNHQKNYFMIHCHHRHSKGKIRDNENVC